MLLLEMFDKGDDEEVQSAEDMEKELDELFAQYEKLKESAPLSEGIFDTTINDLGRKFEAAKKALGIMNKIERGGTKGKWARRTMLILNSIRATINFLRKQASKFAASTIQQAQTAAATE